MIFEPSILQPADSLIYFTPELDDEAIAWKTGSKAGHIEKFIGQDQSVAARITGVDVFPLRLDHLVCVRRPVRPFDLDAALAWFRTVKGTPYGWSDIELDAGLPVEARHGMDCSHFVALFDSAGGCRQFDPNFPPQKITPRDFLLTRESSTVWVADGFAP